ncbi:MAG: leucine-rich repeat domain-containing protein [Planctomyces sp.]|nr:leucine-rich repeat domain-containing protein [Planctomyces sp.]
MKHHFADLLDRDGDYWTVVPNLQRYAHRINDVPAGSELVQIATVGAEDASWRNIFTFPRLEELTLHEPRREQLLEISSLSGLRRLRITHARPKDIDFIGSMVGIEELVLEYVSGFSDLTPLRSLTKLKSLHLENLRRVHDFSGLSGITSLRYLSIDGTLDWKQPIDDFEFLWGLQNLEVLFFGQISNKSPYPATIPILGLKKLVRLKLVWNMLPTEEYALMEVGLQGVKNASWGPYTRFQFSPDLETFEFTGKGAGRVKCGHADAARKCAEFTQRYETFKKDAESVIRNSWQLRERT